MAVVRMKRVLLWLCILTGPVLGQESLPPAPVPAKEAASLFKLPNGFSATLFAGEPAIVQPIAFTFDDRGRVWVVECLSYPKWTSDGKGADRVTMLEDTNGDGKFDVRKVIFNQGANLSGIELGHGGIWLCSSPNLVFIPCDFNADTPTIGNPSIVLDGWNMKDTKHNIFNSLIWGPDGWLYGCNGIQSRSNVGTPGTPAKQRVEINCGVWRYHPSQKVFEAVSHGTTNPFGLDYNEAGEFFITNCVIKHLFHVIPGAHMERMYGQPMNPNAYGLIQSVADYLHWAGGDWTTSRGNKPEHSDAGGGHAHSGASIYLGDNFPPEYRGNLFTCNIHGNRLNQDRLVPHKSGYKSERAPDFLFANDPWFRGIHVKYGPDGGLYVSDWTDTGECHNYVVADTTNGRIFKVVYDTPKFNKIDLSKLSDQELLDLQTHRNDWFPRHARRILHERAIAKKLDANTATKMIDLFFQSKDTLVKLKYLWTSHQIGHTVLVPPVTTLAEHELLESWSLRLATDQIMANTRAKMSLPPLEWSPQTVAASIKTAKNRLTLAMVLNAYPVNERMPAAANFLAALPADDWNDQNIPLLTWYAIEPLVGTNEATTLQLLKAARIPRIREYIVRKATTANQALIRPILAYASTAETAIQRDILIGMNEALAGTRETKAADGWAEFSPKLLTSTDATVREKAMLIAVTYGDQKAIATMTATVSNPKAPKAERQLAIKMLLRRQKADIVPLLTSLLNDVDLRPEAIRGLAAFPNAETPKLLLRLYPKLAEAEREDVIQTLAARADWAMLLLDAIENNTVARKDVSPYVARQIQGIKDPRIAARLTKVWGQILPASAKRVELTKKYKAEITTDRLKKADVSHGRAIFVKVCASCHVMYNEGGNIGPALTGSQRANLDYVLENVLDPSAVVPREYQLSVLKLNSGRQVSGIIKSETEQALTVATANEVLLIRKEEIEERNVSKASMMPEGIFEQLKPDEVIDLIAYLQSREQVPLPMKK